MILYFQFFLCSSLKREILKHGDIKARKSGEKKKKHIAPPAKTLRIKKEQCKLTCHDKQLLFSFP